MRKLSGNASNEFNRWVTGEKKRMLHQSRKKIGYNILTIFLQMILLTPAQQKTYNELRENVRQGQHSRSIDFMITDSKKHKAAEK